MHEQIAVLQQLRLLDDGIRSLGTRLRASEADLQRRLMEEKLVQNALEHERQNLSDLEALCPPDYAGYLGLFLAFADGRDDEEVPDPYFGGPQGFTHVLDLIEAASEGLLRELYASGKLR